jgi:hypothetical protein
LQVKNLTFLYEYFHTCQKGKNKSFIKIAPEGRALRKYKSEATLRLAQSLEKE